MVRNVISPRNARIPFRAPIRDMSEPDQRRASPMRCEVKTKRAELPAIWCTPGMPRESWRP